MKRIIKALNYQIIKDNFTVYVFLFGGIAMFLPLISAFSENVELCGGEYAGTSGEAMAIILTLMILALSTRICGYDLGDKTVNYELMSGHSRKEVFFARIAVSALWCFAGGLIILLLPVVFITAKNGWGENLSGTDALLRLLLGLLPMARLICTSAVLAFLMKNGFAAAIIGFLMTEGSVMAQILVQSFAQTDISCLFGVTSLMDAFNAGGYYLAYIDGKDVPVFKSALSGALVLRTAASSLGFSAAALIMGWSLFRKSDMK